jgi:hypothetical protein
MTRTDMTGIKIISQRPPNSAKRKVWHLVEYGQTVGTYRTRQDAREAAHRRLAIKKSYEAAL